MAMAVKEESLFVWVIVVVALSFVFHHFWASTFYALGRAAALNMVSLLGLAKLVAGICGLHFLP
jgi:hypothetical protein